MKAFEKVMQRIHDNNHKPVHTVVRYNYTMETSREHMLGLVQRQKTVPFEKVFEMCEDRVHAIFLFLSLLELVQMKYMGIMIGEGKNNFILEWNEEREEDVSTFFTEEDQKDQDDREGHEPVSALF
jgi:segregation and condensation protein A